MWQVFENTDMQANSLPQSKRDPIKDTMPVLKREEIKLAQPSESPPFDFDEDSLNPFLIQLVMNGGTVPVPKQEDTQNRTGRST